MANPALREVMVMPLFPAHFTALHYIIGIVTFPILTALFGGLMAYQLMQVESGAAQSVRVWRPVALLYESFGFWPAVLCVPVMGLLLLLAFVWKLWSIRQSSSTMTQSQ
jgi:hypothetical protein